MSAFDEIRVAYTDDHLRRDLQGRSLTRRELIVEQERPLAVVVVLEEDDEVLEKELSRLGDPVLARGVPVLGMPGGLGGAIRGTKPHVDGIR